MTSVVTRIMEERRNGIEAKRRKEIRQYEEESKKNKRRATFIRYVIHGHVCISQGHDYEGAKRCTHISSLLKQKRGSRS